VPVSKDQTHYNRINAQSNNNMRSTWKIINEVKGKITQYTGIYSIMTENKVVPKQDKIAEALTNIFYL
jgi:hypothetical protein